MAKLTTPVRDAARLLDLVPFLDTHPYISIAELSTEFKVTEDEMRALLTTLTMCGTPGLTPYDLIEVNFDSDVVTINQHDNLNIVRTLTSEEALATLLGLTLMKEESVVISTELQGLIDSLITKIHTAYGDHISADNNPSVRLAQQISEYIKHRRQIVITYGSSTTPRQIDPLNIVESNGTLYCESYCFTAGDFRTFALDRIGSIEVASQAIHYSAPTDHNTSKKLVSLALHRNRRYFAEKFSITRVNRHNEGECHYYSDSWFIQEVTASGGQVEALGDGAIRSAIAAHATEILKLYQD